jgi:hypothetical protein
MPFASLLHDRFLSSSARGRGHLDWSAIAMSVAEDAGIEARPAAAPAPGVDEREALGGRRDPQNPQRGRDETAIEASTPRRAGGGWRGERGRTGRSARRWGGAGGNGRGRGGGQGSDLELKLETETL